MQTERLVFITQCHVDRNWPAQARVRLYHSCTAMSLVHCTTTAYICADPEKILGDGGGAMDVYVCQRGEGGQIYSVILLRTKKKDLSKVPRPPTSSPLDPRMAYIHV